MAFFKKRTQKDAGKTVSKESPKQKIQEESLQEEQGLGRVKISKTLKTISKTANAVLIRPIITEKATDGEAKNRYVFEVSLKANKILVKKAIKEVYNLTPIKINIIKVKGKKVRYGRTRGTTKNYKKAIVFLKSGEKIETLSEKSSQ